MLNGYDDVLEIKDLCAILKIGRKTAYKLLQDGDIPHRRIGRVYKIPKDALIQYLKNS